MIDVTKKISGVSYNGIPLELIGIPLPSDITKITSGSATIASTIASNAYRFNHSLGEVPKFVLVWSDDAMDYHLADINYELVLGCLIRQTWDTSESSKNYCQMFSFRRGNNGSMSTNGVSATTESQLSGFLTSTDFCLNKNDLRLHGGFTYKWIAWA